MDRLVSALVPSRIPPGACAFWSPDTAFSARRQPLSHTRAGRRTVDGDAREVADLLDLAARHTSGPQIPKDEVVLRAVSLKPVSVVDELRSKRLRVRDDLLRVRLPRWFGCLLECSRNGGNGL